MNIALRLFANHAKYKVGVLKRAVPLPVCISPNYFSSLCKRDYEKFCDSTLDSLSEYFENIAQLDLVSDDFDVSLDSGVLTIHASPDIGTYVINKQAPNLQIWLSSPISGPKRYDFVKNTWVYAHDGKYLHQLLEEEFSKQLNLKVNLSELPHHYTKQT